MSTWKSLAKFQHFLSCHCRRRYCCCYPIRFDPSALSRARILCYYICFQQHHKCLRKVLIWCVFFLFFFCYSISLCSYCSDQNWSRVHHLTISANTKFITSANKTGYWIFNDDWPMSIHSEKQSGKNEEKKNCNKKIVFISIQVTQLVGKLCAMFRKSKQRLQWARKILRPSGKNYLKINCIFP